MIVLVAAPACAAHGPDLASRMASAQGMAASFGYAPFGASFNGAVEPGKDKRQPLQLKEGCYQIFAFAGDGLKGLDLALEDPAGKGVGTPNSQDGQSSIKHCVADAGQYTVIVKSSGGSGAFVAQPYASTSPTETAGSRDPAGRDPDCTGDDCGDEHGGSGGWGGDECQGGTELTAGGSVKGTSDKRASNNSVRLSCAAADGPVAVYRMHVEGRHKLVLDMSAHFDAVMGLIRAADGYLCEPANEIECADDSDGVVNKGHIETVVDTGDYGVLIGGYDGERGDFEVRSRLEDAPSLDGICAAARAITPGVKQSESLGGIGSNFRQSCSSGDGDELLYKLDLREKSRLRVAARSPSGGLILAMRGRCDDPSTEIFCSNSWHFEGYAWTGLQAAGSYTLFVEGDDAGRSGNVDLAVDTAPEGGDATVESDSCKDAKPLPVGNTITLDTLHAKPDLKATCASEPSADVVYKLDVKSKQRIYITSAEDEARHVVAIQKGCGDTKGELACDYVNQSKGVDASLDPGTWYVVVKGKAPADFGRVRLNVRTRELAPTIAACRAATKITSGSSISDTTVGQTDKFASPLCGGAMSYQASADRVYQFALKERSRVKLELKGSTFGNAILSLRSVCDDVSRGEIVCGSNYSKVIDRDLEAGTYYAIVDGFGTKGEGPFTLEMNAKPIK